MCRKGAELDYGGQGKKKDQDAIIQLMEEGGGLDRRLSVQGKTTAKQKKRGMDRAEMRESIGRRGKDAHAHSSQYRRGMGKEGGSMAKSLWG